MHKAEARNRRRRERMMKEERRGQGEEREGERSAVWTRSTGDMSHGERLPGGSLVQSINGNSSKTAASLAHPALGYALLEFDGL